MCGPCPQSSCPLPPVQELPPLPFRGGGHSLAATIRTAIKGWAHGARPDCSPSVAVYFQSSAASVGAHGIKPVEYAGGAAVRRPPQELRAQTATGHNAGRCGHGGKSAAQLPRQRRSGRSLRRFASDIGGRPGTARIAKNTNTYFLTIFWTLTPLFEVGMLKRRKAAASFPAGGCFPAFGLVWGIILTPEKQIRR